MCGISFVEKKRSKKARACEQRMVETTQPNGALEQVKCAWMGYEAFYRLEHGSIAIESIDGASAGIPD